MPFRDLREFLVTLENQGELKRVGVEVDWDLEAGAITRRIIELRGPAALFEKVKGYPEGYKLVGPLFGPTQPVIHGRVALTLDLPKDTPTLELIRTFDERTENPVKPKLVSTGPCKENIMRDENVDLEKFPVPVIHGGDGGRYLGTWGICVTKDPDTGWANWGVYRLVMHDKKTLGIRLYRQVQHGGSIFYRKYHERGRPMPIAIAIGCDPSVMLVGAISFPFGASEADMAGALRGKPVELCKCETVDLEVPATSEIVVEGEVPPDETLPEGPFGEFLGYFAGGRNPQPIVKVKCVTHRDDPILPMGNVGKLWDESAVPSSIGTSAMIRKTLRSRGIPFTAVYSPTPIGTIVACSSLPGIAHRVACALWGSESRMGTSPIYAVGDDVDPTNLEDVMWCLTTRLNPTRGIHIMTRTPVMQMLAPNLSPEERQTGISSVVYFDATFPPDWSPKYREEHTKIVDFEHGWPLEIKEKVLKRWDEYFLTNKTLAEQKAT